MHEFMKPRLENTIPLTLHWQAAALVSLSQSEFFEVFPREQYIHPPEI